jgi:hypothetical protein
MDGCKTILVLKHQARAAKVELESMGLLDKTKKIVSFGEEVAIPVIAAPESVGNISSHDFSSLSQAFSFRFQDDHVLPEKNLRSPQDLLKKKVLKSAPLICSF